MSHISPGTTDLGEEDWGFPSTHNVIVCHRQTSDKYFLKDVDGQFADQGDQSTVLGNENTKFGLFISDLCGLFLEFLKSGCEFFEARCGLFKKRLDFERFCIGCDVV